MRKILITGGAGFIGSHTTDLLLENGYHVRILDNLDQQIHGEKRTLPSYIDSRTEIFLGDVRNRQNLIDSLDDIDGVFHFAAQTGVGQSMYDIHNYCDVNINGTAMLIDVLANTKNKVKKLILSSSRAVYGEGSYVCKNCGILFPEMRCRNQFENKLWTIICQNCFQDLIPTATKENRPLKPISIYAITKKVQEELVQNFSSIYFIPSVILRYFNVYGSRQAINNPYTGIGAIFSNRAMSNNDIHIYEDGNPGRDFVNVKDVVRANLLALENPAAENGIFNIGSGVRLTILDLAKKIIEKTGSSSQLKLTGQYRIGDIRDCYADLTKSREILGYEPQISFEEGVADLISWARKEEVKDTYHQAVEALREKKLG